MCAQEDMCVILCALCIFPVETEHFKFMWVFLHFSLQSVWSLFHSQVLY